MPLINVVFLLLIFFMIAGQLTTTDPFPITPLRSATGGDPDLAPKLLLIGRDGRLALDGVALDEATLLARFRDAGLSTVRLKADGAVPATTVIALMERLRDAGLRDLHLLTVPTTE
ncbi:ExbD/TolR family protein [Minwuia sp.]|uniref:ExbD/TolR family protein n=1 Tax=Minwuia sp. TaxID=2493630 RepID=UPI003A8D2A95